MSLLWKILNYMIYYGAAKKINIQRKCYEYDDVDDLIAGVKKRDGKDAVISALNHVPPYY